MAEELRTVDILGAVLVGALLGYMLCDSFQLWRSPEAYWKRYLAARAARKVRAVDGSWRIFDSDRYGFQSQLSSFVVFKIIFNSVAVVLLIIVLGMAVARVR